MKLCWEATGGRSRVMCERSPYRNYFVGIVVSVVPKGKFFIEEESKVLPNIFGIENSIRATRAEHSRRFLS